MTERQLVSSGAVWESTVGYSRAVRVGNWVSVAGTTGGTGSETNGSKTIGSKTIGSKTNGSAAEQTREALRRIELALAEVGATLRDVVRTRMFVTDISRWEEIGTVHGEVFRDMRPASSMVQVSALIEPGLVVEIEADAIIEKH